MVKIKGTEKAVHGYSGLSGFITPGAVTAGVSIPLPEWAKGAQDILHCVVVTLSDGTATGASAEQTVVAPGTAAPSTGEVSLYDKDNIRLGDNTTALSVILITLKYKSFTVEL